MNKLITLIFTALLCISVPIAAAPTKSSAAPVDSSALAKKRNTDLVNINTATSEQLQTLPGIGPKKAEAIIRYRLEHSGFTETGQITLVPGIGVKLAEKVGKKITI